MKRYSFLISLLLLPLIAHSCIFRNDPLAPNSAPVLEGYEPDEMYITLVIPDGMTFRSQSGGSIAPIRIAITWNSVSSSMGKR